MHFVKAQRKCSALILFLCCPCVGGELRCYGQQAHDIPGQVGSAAAATPQPSKDSSQTAPSNPPTDTADTKDEKKHKLDFGDPNGSIVAAPLPIVSPALGTGIIPVLGYITPIPAKDKKI